MADKAHALTDREIEKMQRHIAGIYSRAQKDVSAQLHDYSLTVEGKADKLLRAIIEAKTESEKRKAESAYRRFFLVQVKRDKAFIKAVERASERLYKANTEAAEYINTKAAGVYALNYNQIGEGLKKDLDGYEFKPVSESDAEKYGRLSMQTIDEKKDRAWNEKNVRNAVIAGAVALTACNKIFNNAAKGTTKKNRNSANRQASDMMTDAESKGRLDSMYRASDEGFGVKKYWIATLDNRTRPTHRIYDGLDPVDLDYEYAPGLKKPRDPNCPDPNEVCGCRCRILYNTGRQRSATRAAREGTVKGTYRIDSNFRGTKTVSVPNMSYREWMEWRSR